MQQSAADEGPHRGVFKWFKRMRRASQRLPAYKERWRAHVHALQAGRRAEGKPELACMHSEASDPATDSDDYDD